MFESKTRARLIKLLLADSKRMAILDTVAQLNLPDGYVAAGFLRNLAWDDCHELLAEHQKRTKLNDVDIIYFDAQCLDTERPEQTAKVQETALKQQLEKTFPNVQWDVKNQARMHFRNQHPPYKDTCDAMSFWPEKETAVGVRLTSGNEFEFVAPFGLGRLFRYSISFNHKREIALFDQRVQQKHWLDTWPKLKTHYVNDEQ